MSEGSGPHGSDPSVHPSDLEAARLRVYRPDASPDDVAAYERLLGAVSVESDTVEDAQPLQPAPESITRLRRAPIATLIGVGVVGVTLLVLVLLPRGSTPRADQLALPNVAGTTLATVSRQHDPDAGPNTVTYQPAGYTVFQPAGRTVRVGIRCQGSGTVAVGAGDRFVFHCGDRVQVLQRVGQATTRPFVVIATTRGDVVWAARVTVF